MDLRKLDKKLLMRLAIMTGAIILIVLVIVVAKLISGNRISYVKIEEKLLEAAKEYYLTNAELLPKQNGGEVEITLEKLIENNYMKDTEKLVLDKEAKCSGKVTIKNNNDYILYTSYLSCGKYYETVKLNQLITKETVSSGNGLYQINDEFIFRGESLNNHVSFAGKNWLIIKVNSEGSIKLIETTKGSIATWDDRYNINTGYTTGINDFNISRMKTTLEQLYSGSDFTESDKGFINPQKLCIGKRNTSAVINDGSIECATIVDNWMIGLIQVNEYLTASLDPTCKKYDDPQCVNYNYFAEMTGSYWSITADSTKSYKVYKISGSPSLTDASNTSGIRAVILIDKNVNYVSGNGSIASPYIFN